MNGDEVLEELARVGVDDAVGGDAEAHHRLNLRVRRAVKGRAQRGERGQNPGVLVALDRVVRLHAREHGAPVVEPPRHDAQVDDQEPLEALLGGRFKPSSMTSRMQLSTHLGPPPEMARVCLSLIARISSGRTRPR